MHELKLLLKSSQLLEKQKIKQNPEAKLELKKEKIILLMKIRFKQT